MSYEIEHDLALVVDRKVAELDIKRHNQQIMEDLERVENTLNHLMELYEHEIAYSLELSERDIWRWRDKIVKVESAGLKLRYMVTGKKSYEKDYDEDLPF